MLRCGFTACYVAKAMLPGRARRPARTGVFHATVGYHVSGLWFQSLGADRWSWIEWIL